MEAAPVEFPCPVYSGLHTIKKLNSLGIIRLAKAVGNARMEAACRRALHFGTCSYASIHSILQKQLDAQPLEQELPLPSPTHQNLRGGPYYN